MIKFGSRCELFVPLEAGLSLSVKIGDKAYAGATVIGSVGVGATPAGGAVAAVAASAAAGGGAS